MRTIFSKLIFLPCLFSLVSCQNNDISSEESKASEHDYGEIIDRQIEWNGLFLVGIPQYFVYFYSPTCSHCNQIKNVIIEYALKDERMYFVKYSDEIRIAPDIENTIGATSVDDVAILGTPSLIEISNSVLKMNIAGTKAILTYLEIPFPD